MNFLVAYPATLAAKRERLIDFRCVIEKKELPKKYIITKDGVNRIPTVVLICTQVINDMRWKFWKRRNSP